jgi:ankyrin repeat protein
MQFAALHLAVSKGHVEMVKCLLSHGADANAKKANTTEGISACADMDWQLTKVI